MTTASTSLGSSCETRIRLVCLAVSWLLTAALHAASLADPICGLPGLLLSETNRTWQSDSTRRLAQRIEQLRDAWNPHEVPFCSDRLADIMLAALPSVRQPANLAMARFQTAVQLQLAGRIDEALKLFDALEVGVREAGMALPPEVRIQLRRQRILAFMRLGETQNCLLNHTAESCLFPIAPAGFHKVTRGSREASILLRQQLDEFPTDHSARWLLNLAHMTLGEYVQGVDPRWLIPPSTFNSDYPLPRFPDVAPQYGLNFDTLAGGVIADDFDNDGLMDLVLSSMSLDDSIRFYRNLGNSRFLDCTASAGLLGLTGGLNIQQTDYDNDGLLDIWVLRGAWLGKAGRIPNSLLRNLGGGTFTDVTEQSGLLSLHPTQSSVWFDFDGDGWLDLFVANETIDPADPDPCELFRNNRDGTFTECAARTGLAVHAFVKGVTSADYDHDGRPDLYLSIRDAPNRLFRNSGPQADGTWLFMDTTSRAGVAEPVASFPTWFFDFDNDGWEDLFVSGYSIQNVGDVSLDYLGQPNSGTTARLYRNNRDGTFQDISKAARVNRVLHSMGCNFGDLDNDGWLDFYLGTGDPDFGTLIPNRMFRNAEGRFFQDVTTAGGFGHLQKGHAIAFVDLDNDGDQDVYSHLGGAYPGDKSRNAFFLNPGTTNAWIQLQLEGVRANRAAIGARIEITVNSPAGSRSIFKTVNSGASFGSSPLRQFIGLGSTRDPVRVRILWPGSGTSQSIDGLTPNRAYLIRENSATAVHLPLRSFSFASH